MVKFRWIGFGVASLATGRDGKAAIVTDAPVAPAAEKARGGDLAAAAAVMEAGGGDLGGAGFGFMTVVCAQPSEASAAARAAVRAAPSSTAGVAAAVRAS